MQELITQYIHRLPTRHVPIIHPGHHSNLDFYSFPAQFFINLTTSDLRLPARPEHLADTQSEKTCGHKENDAKHHHDADIFCRPGLAFDETVEFAPRNGVV